jgi:uncharacterized protein YndB with AHSA1/START domain
MRPFLLNPRPSRMKTEIRWPERYLPAHSAVFVSNEVIIPAAPEAIWRWLIRAELWPEWYTNASDIHFLSTSGPDLRDRSRFRWHTFGARITSKVLEFEPYSRIAWDAQGIGIDGYHAWRLTPLGDGSTEVLTQETQNGWRARIGKLLMPGRMQAMHQLWLESLKAKVASGPPPEVFGAATERAPAARARKLSEG